MGFNLCAQLSTSQIVTQSEDVVKEAYFFFFFFQEGQCPSLRRRLVDTDCRERVESWPSESEG